ncbi:MAG TPA: alpha/beta hydrolase [Myxococcota bacterium]|nr:alpha/beta hydrolase [Myxococcota bacterium]
MGLALVAAMALVLAGGLGSCVRLDGFLFDPEPAPAGGYDLASCPLDDASQPPVGDLIAGADVEEVTLDVAGETLDARFVHGLGGGGGATVLYSHGKTGNLCTFWGRVLLLYQLDYDVLVYDYEGYGASTGRPSEPHLYRDARAALDYLRGRPDVDPGRIVYYGWSLGAAVAIDLAVDEPPAALITESAFASVSAFTSDSTGLDVPGHFLARSSFDNLAKMPLLTSPVLLMHGDADDFVRFAYAEQLFDAAPLPRELYRAAGAGHSDVPYVDLGAWASEVSNWIDTYAP